MPRVPPAGTSANCGACGAALPAVRPRGSWFGRFCVGSLLTLDGLFVLLIAVFSVLDYLGPERWWLTGFLLYMPRVVGAIVAALLLLPTAIVAGAKRASGRRRWKMTAVLGMALLWLLGPLMGFRVPLRFPVSVPTTATGTHLRVLTYNVKSGLRDPNAIVREIESSQPDLIQMQDSGDILGRGVGRLLSPEKGWTVRERGQYIIASRWQLSELTPVDVTVPLAHEPIVSATLTPPGNALPITLYNAHLLSARHGLVSVRSSVRSHDVTYFEANVQSRLVQSEKLAAAIERGPRGPVLLTGDLNAPPSSLVKRHLKATGLRDAFEAAGTGYGFTYGQSTKVGRPYIRIDCVMTTPDIRAASIRVGNTIGSDHSPVIADLILPQRR